jgi:hypothetical protein
LTKVDGLVVGNFVGGLDDGLEVGAFVGIFVGGLEVGLDVGRCVGAMVGILVGDLDVGIEVASCAIITSDCSKVLTLYLASNIVGQWNETKIMSKANNERGLSGYITHRMVPVKVRDNSLEINPAFVNLLLRPTPSYISIILSEAHTKR